MVAASAEVSGPTVLAAHRLERHREAADHAEPVRDLVNTNDVAGAYRIQTLLNARRVENGAARVGRKIGLTSPAVQHQLGVHQPDFGVLFDDMAYPCATDISISRFLQPKIEAEVAFQLGHDIDDTVSAATVSTYVSHAMAALEIVDSRIRNWDITIVDTIADNASSGGFVLGSTSVPLHGIDLPAVEMTLTEDGELASAGHGHDCLGDPLAALAWLANACTSVGDPLRRGEIVLSGALGPMTPVRAGARYSATISSIGEVAISFSDSQGGHL